MQTYRQFISETITQANVVRNLGRIVQNWIDTKLKTKSSGSVTYKNLFGAYRDDPVVGEFIQRLFSLMKTDEYKTQTPSYVIEPMPIAYMQTRRLKGGFDPKTLSVIAYDADEGKFNYNHELSHLYDFVMAKTAGYDNRDSYVGSEQDYRKYHEQEYEVRARFYQELNRSFKYYLEKFKTGNRKFYDDVMRDAKIPKQFRKKYIGDMYKILKSAEDDGIQSTEIIVPPPKIVQPKLTKEEKLQATVSSLGGQPIKITTNDYNIEIRLTDDVISKATLIDGVLQYPILDAVVEFYKKTTKSRIVTDAPEVIFLLSNKYNLKAYQNKSNYRVNDEQLHFKQSHLKSDTPVVATEIPEHAIRRLLNRDKLEQIWSFVVKTPNKNSDYFDDPAIKSRLYQYMKIDKSDREFSDAIYQLMIEKVLALYDIANMHGTPIPKRFVEKYFSSRLDDFNNHEQVIDNSTGEISLIGNGSTIMNNHQIETGDGKKIWRWEK